MPCTYVVIPAAGRGLRMGDPTPKQFIPVHGVPILIWTVKAFVHHPAVAGVVIAAAPQETERVQALLREYQCLERVQVVAGGDNRPASVANALSALPTACDVVLVHDAVRPCVSAELISRIAAAAAQGCVTAALPIHETVKMVADGAVIQTLDRSLLWSVQTPQGFPRAVLTTAHRTIRDKERYTDDCALVEALGEHVQVEMGDPRNIKITVPTDLALAETYLAEQSVPEAFPGMGIGYDVHRLVEGRALVLGGVVIPYEYGLLGHSDADVLLHAVMDALLGAAGLGDIGRHFPDTDPTYAGASSLVLLARVEEMLRQRGLEPAGVDVTLVAERPKIAPYVMQMRANIAQTLRLPIDAVNVKATTNEAMGFIGRREGMAALAAARVQVRRKP